MYRFILRLNKSDLDIIALSEDGGFKGAVKSALSSFVSGKGYSYPMPASLPRTEKTAARISFTFNDKEDKAVIDFLNSIKDGAKNSVVLSIIRSALPFPVVSPYLDDDGVFYDIFAKKGKRGRKKKIVIYKNRSVSFPNTLTPSDEKNIIRKNDSATDSTKFTVDGDDTAEKEDTVPVSDEDVMAKKTVQATVSAMAENIRQTGTPATPVRPLLVEAVEEEQAAEGEQTGQIASESTDSETDSFDPFALGADMMNSF